jgi:8-oxo-dGTP pyrophosphatase MutT (NUDIX family)
MTVSQAPSGGVAAGPSVKSQLRVSAMILQPDRGILLCRFSHLDFWMLPGGRVKQGEDLTHAMVRELVEELGVEPSATALRWVIENYFDVGGSPMAEVGFYFAVDLPAGTAAPDGFPGREPGLNFRWWPLTALPDIDLRPANLASLLLDGGAGRFVHRVWRD